MRHLLRQILAPAAALVLSAAVLFGTMEAPAAAGPTGFTTVLVGDVTCQLAQVDLSTGALTPFGPVSANHCAVDLAFAPDGTLYGMVAGPERTSPESPLLFMQLVRFDTTTGAVTVVGQITTFGFGVLSINAGGLAFDNTGTFYAQFASGDPNCSTTGQFCLYRVDPGNPAAATLVGTVPPTDTAFRGLAGACDGRVLTERQPLQVEVDSFLELENQQNAQVTTIGRIGPTGTLLDGFDFDTAGNLWGVGVTDNMSPPKVFAVDQSTGAGTPGATITGAPQGTLSALAVAPLACAPAPAPAAPPVVVVGPIFTG